jgi:hypothetical protein
VVHAPPLPAVAGARIELVFTVIGDDRPAAADALVRTAGDTAFTRVAAEERKGVYRAAVPERFVASPGFEYFLLVRTLSGGEITSPARNPAESPHRVPVLSAEATARIVILSPEEGEIVADSSVFAISVLFDPPLASDDSASLYLDGRRVTEGIERTEDYLYFRPERAPARGAHEARAAVRAASGEIGERSWTFFFEEGPEGAALLALSGRIEAGWASVSNAGIEGEPYVLYEKTSSLAFDGYASGSWGERALFLSSSRDPIYDGEIRATGRLHSESFMIEGGDVYPSFSEMTVSWLSGKGALATVRRGAIESSCFFLRSLPSDTAGGLGVYSQFLAGEKVSVAGERWDAALQTAYGWERESSVPETLRFLSPVKNLVVSGSASLRAGKERRLDAEIGWSDTEENERASGGGWRILATILDSPRRGLSLEAHDYRSDFASLASPTVEGGEYGAILSASARAWTRFRQSFRAEVLRDRKSAQELDPSACIVQLYGRTDIDWKAREVDWNHSLILRSHEIPYADRPYKSAYGTLGFSGRGKTQTISISGTRSETRSSSRTRSWSAGAYWSGGAANGRFAWKLGERCSFSETKQDTTGTGVETTIAKPERWSFTAECGVRLAGIEWRAEYERIDENDPPEEERFTQHLFLLVAGRRF